MNKETMNKVKTIVRFVTIGLVDLFSSAAINHVVDPMNGPRIAKFGAKAGGFLVGTMVGDKVADYICDQFEETASAIEEAKESVKAETTE